MFQYDPETFENSGPADLLASGAFSSDACADCDGWAGNTGSRRFRSTASSSSSKSSASTPAAGAIPRRRQLRTIRYAPALARPCVSRWRKNLAHCDKRQLTCGLVPPVISTTSPSHGSECDFPNKIEPVDGPTFIGLSQCNPLTSHTPAPSWSTGRPTRGDDAGTSQQRAEEILGPRPLGDYPAAAADQLRQVRTSAAGTWLRRLELQTASERLRLDLLFEDVNVLVRQAERIEVHLKQRAAHRWGDSQAGRDSYRSARRALRS